MYTMTKRSFESNPVKNISHNYLFLNMLYHVPLNYTPIACILILEIKEPPFLAKFLGMGVSSVKEEVTGYV